MKSRQVTINMLEDILGDVKKQELGSTILEMFDKYFNIPKDNPRRPEKEVAAWFIQKLNGLSLRAGFSLIDYMFELGYFTLQEALECGLGNVMGDRNNNSRRLKEILMANINAFDIIEDKLKDLLERESKRHSQNIADAILSSDFSNLFEYDEKGSKESRRYYKSYMSFIDRSFNYLMSISSINKEYDMWRGCFYIPVKVIKNKFLRAMPISSDMKHVMTGFKRYAEVSRAPYEIIVDELIPFFELIYRISFSSYCPDIGIEGVLKMLTSEITHIGNDKSGRRAKLYNLFFKPMINNPKTVENLFPLANVRTSNDILRFIKLGGAVVPASDLVVFTNSCFKFVATQNIHAKAHVLDCIAAPRIECSLPVTKEFIDIQYKFNYKNESRICLNNNCVNEIDFWKERFDGARYFSPDLSFNPSFNSFFKLNVKDLQFFIDNEAEIKWNGLRRLYVIPEEFLLQFPYRFLIEEMSKEALGSLSEKIISNYIEVGSSFSYSFFKHNKNLSASFIAKNINKLYTDKRSCKEYKHIKLSELVAASC